LFDVILHPGPVACGSHCSSDEEAFIIDVDIDGCIVIQEDWQPGNPSDMFGWGAQRLYRAQYAEYQHDSSSPFDFQAWESAVDGKIISLAEIDWMIFTVFSAHMNFVGLDARTFVDEQEQRSTSKVAHTLKSIRTASTSSRSVHIVHKD
jgi:hypothetical protein